MMTDIVERLRFEAFDAVNWDGETMKQWDKIRKQAETLPGSDLPRLMFQGLIESLAELMVESAFEIERLRNDAQSAWQPIETAPKDGSRILLFQRDRGAFEGWFHMDGFWMDDPDSEPEPTHWMPRPEAPALPSAQRQEAKP